VFTLLLFLILSIFPLLFFFFPTTVFAHSQLQIIEITAQGFDPQAVTVHENATVIFYNKDTQDHWPASNSHPTHDIYPEFDPQKPLAPKASWVLKPKKGEWRYHDHLHPHLRGILIVKPEPKPSAQPSNPPQEKKDPSLSERIIHFFKSIKTFFIPQKEAKSAFTPPSQENFRNLSTERQTEVLEILAKDDSQKAWQYFKEAYQNQSGAQGSVHDLAHLAGSLMYKELGLAGLSSCSQEFAFGCFHGFLDKAFSKNLDHLSAAEDACLKLDKSHEVTGPVASCIHGIGHGVASYYLTNDLPASLQSCKSLTKGSQYCFDGVFMEYVRNAQDTFFHKDDPLYPCNQFDNDDVYAIACGRNQPSLLLDRFHKSFDEVATVCGSSKSQPFKKACFDAIGFSLASSGNVTQITSGCQSIKDPEFMANCMEAAAAEMVFQQIPNWSQKSHEVCVALPANRRESCLKYLQNIMEDYYGK
jgi:hypothetical protein